MNTKNALYIVSTPIGNPDDITLRAIKTLKTVDALICEEFRNGSKLLKKNGIEEKEIIALNEHNESGQIENILIRLAQGQNLALVSDCGTPLFSDPGHLLIEAVIDAGFTIIPIPGVSALTTAISVTPLHMKNFVFGGFLPRDPEERLRQLKNYKQMRMPIILMDTPYRLTNLLSDISKVFGKNQRITLTLNLTLPNEWILTGACDELIQKIGPMKAEFMLIIHQEQQAARNEK
ncbi:MAG: 16S rRNA (cytidine(1402)-2'-O)-methyltransferase [Flexilinea flocculi]|nr:16S rRNA (cytidine(1402)-2'-O)-methyltransferase [Flexilinea flocculi]